MIYNTPSNLRVTCHLQIYPMPILVSLISPPIISISPEHYTQEASLISADNPDEDLNSSHNL